MELYRVGVKVFCEDGSSVELRELIPIFHRWIQTHALAGVLIDVADYSHVSNGPGILLVAHEGIYGVDETGGRRGLVYSVRQPSAGTLADRLAATARATLTACYTLAAEPEVAGRMRFRGEELQIFANDRLLAPNTDATLRELEPVLTTLLARLYPGLACAVAREPDHQERFAVSVRAPEPVGVDTLLDRLAR